MKQIILGTAGHVDHGKTALIKALTGIDTDRLKEERERGITIELGFAFLSLPNGKRLGIVDVPGHEKFVRHMVAGAGGMDIVALVVAADEGVMPQTKEHLEICSLLKVKKGLVIITKIDMVESNWLDLVEADIKESLRGTFLENAPLVKVSSVTKQGLPELIATLGDLAEGVTPKPINSLFRLPIDRIFTIKGFGTVVTGTIIGGGIKVKSPLMVYPEEIDTKVRSLQVHNQDVNEALAGQRTAINLLGVGRGEIKRGDVLAPPGSLIPSFMLAATLEILPSAPGSLKNRSLVHLHLYTSERLASTILLDKEELKPGETSYVQFCLKQSVVALRGDRFVIRSSSPLFTFGGGMILHPAPLRYKRMFLQVIENLKNLETGDLEKLILTYLNEAKYRGLSKKIIRTFTNNFSQNLENTLKTLQETGKIHLINKDNSHYVHNDYIEELCPKIISFLKSFHASYPLLSGISKEELKSKLLPFSGYDLFNFILQFLEEKMLIALDQHLVRLKTHKIRLTQQEKQIKVKIYHLLSTVKYSPPSPKEIAQILKVNEEKIRQLLRLLIEEKKVVRIKEDFYFGAESIERLKNALINYLKTHGGITPAEFKRLTDASRKYNIALLEYFDYIKLTLRLEDKRILR